MSSMKYPCLVPRRLFAILSMCVLSGVLLGCSLESNPLPTTLEGAWLGEGEFTASRGSMDMKAQLELLSDGSYRFVILEPGIMMLTGAETGVWSRESDELVLRPGTFERDADGSVFQNLRDSDTEKAKAPKHLAVAHDLSELQFKDGPVTLTFRPNAEATAALRTAGDVRP